MRRSEDYNASYGIIENIKFDKPRACFQIMNEQKITLSLEVKLNENII